MSGVTIYLESSVEDPDGGRGPRTSSLPELRIHRAN